MPKLRKIGSYVYVPDENVCRDSFGWWPSTRVFRVSSVRRLNDGTYCYWVYSYSKGLKPKNVVTATLKQIRDHLKIYDKNGIKKNELESRKAPKRRNLRHK